MPMKKLAISYLIIFFVCPTAWAQNSDFSNTKKVVIDGKEYVAFTPSDAQYLLQLYVDFPNYKAKIESLEKLVFNKDKQITKTKSMVDNVNQQLFISAQQQEYLRKEVNSAYAWYRNTWFLLCMGVIVGVGATIGIAEVVK